MEEAAQTIWTTPEVVRTGIMLLAVLVAVISVLSVKSTAKKKQTADLLFAIRSDDRLIRASRTLKELHESDNNIRLWAAPSHACNVDDKDRQVEDIRYILNHYERLSVGLQAGIYHEDMLKKSQFTLITKAYERAKPFMEGVREHGSPTAFQEFEWLAKRWERKRLKTKTRK
ncbi:DUF4760 domain-containing protein [Halomonas sp. R1t8]|mgnify:CR=1 FL=1|jgi:hypothetical protein|uniref:DUF4760 domain-containing protein n=1 Tax=unclassified Halomonas TaxID=2609666 RepID=UPI00209C8F19|nr:MULTISPECIES: DUF4760 domain-containing protein [unclassified Halomonas]MCP1305144.1 DUF4760 domain-containing protein [Halomonas sp. R1t8]MCP1331450.1 DUF4760 domain-containing protein [Halomonas sp. R1t4]